MKTRSQSRRSFLKSCLCMAVSGLGSGFVFLAGGCGNKTGADLLSGNGGGKTDDRAGDPAQTGKGLEPAYLSLHKSGELKKRGDELWARMERCDICPRECRANRIEGQRGFCRASAELKVASHGPHFGEESPLVGRGGSGTIFFSHCGLRCVFCINWQISHGGEGQSVTLDDLAGMMLNLQKRGCWNINVVTPTHYLPHILLGLDIAAGKGLRLPVVYNTCGWERPDILKMLDGVVDIYLPDFKYYCGEMASKYSAGAQTYPEVTKTALLEMHRQVGVARPGPDGRIFRGLMIRHLVMPNEVGGTDKVITWIAENLPKDTYLNLMSQYRPMYKANDYPDIARRLTNKEYRDALKQAKDAGLSNLDKRAFSF